MENIRITYTKSLRANDAPGFGFEFQDGQLNCYFAYNDSDRTYSVVGHTGLQMIGNTVTVTAADRDAKRARGIVNAQPGDADQQAGDGRGGQLQVSDAHAVDT